MCLHFVGHFWKKIWIRIPKLSRVLAYQTDYFITPGIWPYLNTRIVNTCSIEQIQFVLTGDLSSQALYWCKTKLTAVHTVCQSACWVLWLLRGYAYSSYSSSFGSESPRTFPLDLNLFQYLEICFIWTLPILWKILKDLQNAMGSFMACFGDQNQQWFLMVSRLWRKLSLLKL